MLRGEGCSLSTIMANDLSQRTSLPPCTTVYNRCTPRPVSGHPPRSPAVADNVAAFPEPVDDRIAREVLNFKLSGAEGEQRYSISNPRGCTCVQSPRIVYTIPLIAEIDSDYRCISLRPHTNVLWCQCQVSDLVYCIQQCRCPNPLSSS